MMFEREVEKYGFKAGMNPIDDVALRELVKACQQNVETIASRAYMSSSVIAQRVDGNDGAGHRARLAAMGL